MPSSHGQMVVFAVLAAALGLFAWGRWRYDLVALGALMAATLAGVVPANEAFAGFGHVAVITVAAVLVLSKGLLNAGAVEAIARGLSRVGRRPVTQMIVLTTLVVLLSSFMNNVGALALVMPVAAWMARRDGYSPSLVLMPLAFGSLLGGMTTLIGTPPNIVIAAYRTETGAAPFAMFDFLSVGAGVTLAGLGVLWAFAARLVPARKGPADRRDLFDIADYLAEVSVPEGSKAAGKTLHALVTPKGERPDVAVVGIVRNGQKALMVSPFQLLLAGDILLVEAAPDALKSFIDATGLRLTESKGLGRQTLGSSEVGVVEAVVSYGSPLVGASAVELDLRQRHGVNVLAVARHGERLRQQLGRIRFATGDILLLQGRRETLDKTLLALGCLPLAERGIQVGRQRRVLLGPAIFLAGLVAASAGLAPVQIALVGAAMAMVLVRVLSLREAYDAIDLPILVLIAALMPVGHAFETTGAARVLGDHLAAMARWGGPTAALVALLAATMLLTNVINNVATAALMAPVALSIAEGLSVSADPLLMAVAIGSSSAFLTPIGHQSNTLVMEPGGYQFGDYWRLGLPVSLAALAAAVPLILWRWPF